MRMSLRPCARVPTAIAKRRPSSCRAGVVAAGGLGVGRRVVAGRGVAPLRGRDGLAVDRGGVGERARVVRGDGAVDQRLVGLGELLALGGGRHLQPRGGGVDRDRAGGLRGVAGVVVGGDGGRDVALGQARDRRPLPVGRGRRRGLAALVGDGHGRAGLGGAPELHGPAGAQRARPGRGDGQLRRDGVDVEAPGARDRAGEDVAAREAHRHLVARRRRAWPRA